MAEAEAWEAVASAGVAVAEVVDLATMVLAVWRGREGKVMVVAATVEVRAAAAALAVVPDLEAAARAKVVMAWEALRAKVAMKAREATAVRVAESWGAAATAEAVRVGLPVRAGTVTRMRSSRCSQ